MFFLIFLFTHYTYTLSPSSSLSHISSKTDTPFLTLRDPQGNTALMRAILNQNFTYFQHLLESGQVNVNEQNPHTGQTALHMLLTLEDTRFLSILLENAFYDNDFKTFQKLLESGQINVNEQNPQTGKTILHVVSTTYNTDFLHLLLEYNANPNIPDNMGYTPLFYSINTGDLEGVKILSQHPEIDLTLLNDKNQTALEYAFFLKKRFPLSEERTSIVHLLRQITKEKFLQKISSSSLLSTNFLSQDTEEMDDDSLTTHPLCFLNERQISCFPSILVSILNLSSISQIKQFLQDKNTLAQIKSILNMPEPYRPDKFDLQLFFIILHKTLNDSSFVKHIFESLQLMPLHQMTLEKLDYTTYQTQIRLSLELPTSPTLLFERLCSLFEVLLIPPPAFLKNIIDSPSFDLSVLIEKNLKHIQSIAPQQNALYSIIYHDIIDILNHINTQLHCVPFYFSDSAESEDDQIETNSFPSHFIDSFSPNQLELIPVSLELILQLQNPLMTQKLLQLQSVKDDFKLFTRQHLLSLKISFLLLNKILNNPIFVRTFFLSCNLSSEQIFELDQIDYETYQKQCELPCSTITSSFSLYQRIKSLFNSLAISIPQSLKNIKFSDDLPQIIQHTIDSLQEKSHISFFLHRLVCIDFLKQTLAWVQNNPLYLQPDEDRDSFLKELEEVSQSDILYEHTIGKGMSGTLYLTKKTNVVAKVYQHDHFGSDEPALLNKLYGYQFSRFDKDNPSIIYMKKINGRTWNSISQDPTIKPQTKLLIIEKILERIYRLTFQNFQHRDLNDNNILVDLSQDIPVIYLIDPRGSDNLFGGSDLVEYKKYKLIDYQYWKILSENNLTDQDAKILLDKLTTSQLRWSPFFGLRTSLHRACFMGNTDQLKRKLREKKIRVDSRDSSNNTPLMIAVTQDNPLHVSLLLKNGANPTFINEDLDSPLLLAARSGHFEHVQTLIETGQININYYNKHHETALTCAIHNSDKNMVLLLLERGIEVNRLDYNRMTPLMLAISLGLDEITLILLKQPNCHLRYKNPKGQSAFSLASQGFTLSTSLSEKQSFSIIIKAIHEHTCNNPFKSGHYPFSKGSLKKVIEHPLSDSSPSSLSSEPRFFNPSQSNRLQHVVSFLKNKNITLQIKMQEQVVSSYNPDDTCLAQNKLLFKNNQAIIEVTLCEFINDIAYLAQLSEDEFNLFLNFVVLNEVLQSLHILEMKKNSLSSLTQRDIIRLETGSFITALLVLSQRVTTFSFQSFQSLLNRITLVGKDYFYTTPELVQIDLQDLDSMTLSKEEKELIQEEHKTNFVNSNRIESNRLKEIFALTHRLTPFAQQNLSWASLENKFKDTELDQHFHTLAEKCFLLLCSA